MGLFKIKHDPPQPFIGKWRNEDYTVYINMGKVEIYHNKKGILNFGKLLGEEFIGGYHIAFKKGVDINQISFVPIRGSMMDFDELVFGVRNLQGQVIEEDLMKVN